MKGLATAAAGYWLFFGASAEGPARGVEGRGAEAAELVLGPETLLDGQHSGVGGVLTVRSERDSKRCRGTTVTSSISQRKATSVGVKPGARGNAISIEVVLITERA